MLKCVIIDDEAAAIRVIEKFAARIPGVEIVGTSINPVKGIELVKELKPDVVFLDIQMEPIDGLEVQKKIHKISKVIFCTAFTEFAAESYELDTVDYLLKPILFPRFAKAVQRATDAIDHSNLACEQVIADDYIYVNGGNRKKIVKVDFDDLEYVVSSAHYLVFHMNTKKVVAYLSMQKLEQTLPSRQFIRVHKSFIVSIKQIASFSNSIIIMKRTNQEIPIGPLFRKPFMDRMMDKLIEND